MVNELLVVNLFPVGIPENVTVSLSHLQCSDFALRVSSRDIAVLLSAFRSIQSDIPAASPEHPSPPIIPLRRGSGTLKSPLAKGCMGLDRERPV